MKKLESLKSGKFKQLSRTEQASVYGGQICYASMPTATPSSTVTDTSYVEDDSFYLINNI